MANTKTKKTVTKKPVAKKTTKKRAVVKKTTTKPARAKTTRTVAAKAKTTAKTTKKVTAAKTTKPVVKATKKKSAPKKSTKTLAQMEPKLVTTESPIANPISYLLRLDVLIAISLFFLLITNIISFSIIQSDISELTSRLDTVEAAIRSLQN